ncbi:Armadillo-type fold [Artemisia annua]|uniref:Armadillo-type fold n=1 Tax=Artemisia annua TaxID=35608 RepID=A0A2U1M2V5_ARTAN|nr:Armadillo-type fold [Artemisia annua]
MANTDVELEQQLKEVGRKLLHPPDSVDELLPLLDLVERLLSKVDQSPKKSMLDALKPSMKALIQDDLLRHSDVDVKVAVASCISEITRITAPDAPYDDDQMRDVFQLIVSSFEDLADQSSRSYIKRASILETVSKVRSCVIMLDLECDGMIVEMFEHFLRSVRDYHRGVIYSSMENIMILVLEESEEISVEMLKPLLVTVKKHNEGVLPIAQKLGEDVLKKSAEKLKPYLMPALTALGDSLDTYTEIVTRVCEGTTAAMKRDDENASGQQPADENQLAKGSQDETQQADDSKITTASSDHVDQVDKEEPCPQEEVNVDPMEGSPKSVMSNGVNVTGNEEASVDQESSKQPDEDEKQQLPDATGKEDVDDSDTDDKLAKSESKPEPTPKKGGKKSDTTMNSAEPSDSSHVEGEKEAEKLESEDEKDNDVKESAISAPVQSETEKDNDDVQVSSPKAIESKSATANVSSPSQSDSLPDVSRIKKAVRSKRKQVPQQDEVDTENAASPSKSGTPLDESRSKKAGRSKNKDLDQEEDTPSVDVKAPEYCSDSDVKPKKRGGKMAVVAKEVKSPATKDSSSDSDVKPQKQPGKKAVVTKEVKRPDSMDSSSDSDLKPLKQAGKKAVGTKEVKLPATIDASEDDEASSDSDEEPPQKISKKQEPDNSRSKSKQSGKKVGAGDSDAKQAKQSDKKSDAKKPKQTGKTTKQSAKKEENSDSDSEPLVSVKKVEKRKKPTVEEEDSDSDAKPLKLSAKKGNASTSGDVKSSSKKKDDGRKRASGKNIIKKDEAKTLSSDDEMDVSPKSAKKPAKGEGNLKETSGTSAKRKRTPVQDKESDTIKYDESLVAKKVKVWWPEDKEYYEGVIESFDAAKKKHKVSYVDGDEENLYLKNQRWSIIQKFSVRDKEQSAEVESEEASPEIHKKKKSKADPAPSASQEKNKDSSKKSKASGSKDNKSKAGKSKEAEDTPKTSTKTKQETSKSSNKSKGKTPQSGSKSNGPNKAKEPENAVKTPEKGGSKKRKK